MIGTVRILDDAADTDLVNLPESLKRLQEFGFYLDDKLVQFLMERHSERERRKRDK